MLLLLLLSLFAVMRGLSALLPVGRTCMGETSAALRARVFIGVMEDCMRNRGGVRIA